MLYEIGLKYYLFGDHDACQFILFLLDIQRGSESFGSDSSGNPKRFSTQTAFRYCGEQIRTEAAGETEEIESYSLISAKKALIPQKLKGCFNVIYTACFPDLQL